MTGCIMPQQAEDMFNHKFKMDNRFSTYEDMFMYMVGIHVKLRDTLGNNMTKSAVRSSLNLYYYNSITEHDKFMERKVSKSCPSSHSSIETITTD